jgi:hypothetical protein
MDDYPTTECPKCGKEQTDMDGFGFIACIPGCGHCLHLCAEKKPGDENWKCTFCGRPVSDGLADLNGAE